MADLILNNANVITMDPALPRAKRVAIRDGKISAVAGNDKLKELRHKNTEVIDCKGKTVLPGFIDAHFHLHGFAESLVALNLEPRNKDDNSPSVKPTNSMYTYRLSSPKSGADFQPMVEPSSNFIGEASEVVSPRFGCSNGMKNSLAIN